MSDTNLVDVENTIRAIRESIARDKAYHRELVHLLEASQSVVDRIFNLWVEWHPFTLDKDTLRIYKEFALEMDAKFKDLQDGAASSDVVIKPLLKLAVGSYDNIFEQQPDYFKGFAGGFRRVRYWLMVYRRLLTWCWRIQDEVSNV